MRFAQITKEESFETVDDATMAQLSSIMAYIRDLVGIQSLKGKLEHIKFFQKLIEDKEFKTKFYNKLCTTKDSKELYHLLLWKENILMLDEIKNRFDIDLNNITKVTHDYSMKRLDGVYKLIYLNDQDFYESIIFVHERIRPILKLLLPLPEDYGIQAIRELEDTEFSYSNEQGVLSFVPLIDDMLQNNLVNFGKTGEKPLAKTLNILKSSSATNEFFTAKTMDRFATDMLTRSFSFYRWEMSAKFQKAPQDTIMKFLKFQFEDKFRYSIIRTFTAHLRKVRYGYFLDGQKSLFIITRHILNNIPKKSWSSVENILNFCKYNDFRFDLESFRKTREYYIDIDTVNKKYSWRDQAYCDDVNYNALFFEPVIKAMLFYLGSLGILELKYNEPTSPHSIKQKGKNYISVWDGLRYIRFTALGLYVLGFEKKYRADVTKVKKTDLKFDAYKPIITVDSSDIIAQAKLEPYVVKYDTDRYILNYAQIFKNCTNQKVLNLKIDNFYKTIEPKPPKIVDDFFQNIKKKSALITKETQNVVLVLQKEKELLNLFMTNRTIKELVIKATGYRVVVDKDNLPLLRKIVQENGFFVEF
ncbi:MAG: hypothetical protein JJW00_01715 [Sulfurimonas sp.]|nr:hypothetical protein [Sulfurimonas sp.]